MKRRLAALGAALALGALVGCGSSASSGSPSGPPSNAGGSGTATLHIGLANMDTGTTSFPAITQAAEVAAKYLNGKGGIGGQKFQLITCDLKNDNQAAQECGQKFANDGKMPFAILGPTLNGGPFYAAMNAAKKPILGTIGITPADNGPQDTFFYYPGATYYQDVAQYIKAQNYKSVSYIYEKEAASTAGEQSVQTALKNTGITFKSVGIPTAASDVTPQVQSAGIKSSDVTGIFTSGTCPQIAQAMQSLGIKPKNVIAVNTCLTPDNISKSPSLYQNWTLVAPNKLAAIGPGVDPEVTTFLQQYTEIGPGGAPGTFAELGWGAVLTAGKVFNGASSVTAASALKALQSYTGSVVLGPGSVSCPGPAPFTATCGKGLTYYKLNNGKFEPSNG